jgi:hypothetical protein
VPRLLILSMSSVWDSHLSPSSWECVTALYLKDSQSNMSKAWAVLKLLCLAYGAKFATIWASKEKKGMGVGTRSWAEKDPQGTRGSIPRHPNRLLATH